MGNLLMTILLGRAARAKTVTVTNLRPLGPGPATGTEWYGSGPPARRRPMICNGHQMMCDMCGSARLTDFFW